MMLLFVLLCVGLVIGVLACIKHDVPELYAKAQRIVGGLLFALLSALALGGTAFFFMPMGCNNFEEYSALWYLFWCMGPSH